MKLQLPYYHKKIAKEFEGQFECLGENTEKYKTFSVPMKEEVAKVNKEENENIITISYKIKFIDSARFMASSLSNLADNLAKGIHVIKCKDCGCFLLFFLNYSNKIDKELKNLFKSTFKFSNNDIDKFILLLKKCFSL